MCPPRPRRGHPPRPHCLELPPYTAPPPVCLRRGAAKSYHILVGIRASRISSPSSTESASRSSWRSPGGGAQLALRVRGGPSRTGVAGGLSLRAALGSRAAHHASRDAHAPARQRRERPPWGRRSAAKFANCARQPDASCTADETLPRRLLHPSLGRRRGCPELSGVGPSERYGWQVRDPMQA